MDSVGRIWWPTIYGTVENGAWEKAGSKTKTMRKKFSKQIRPNLKTELAVFKQASRLLLNIDVRLYLQGWPGGSHMPHYRLARTIRETSEAAVVLIQNDFIGVSQAVLRIALEQTQLCWYVINNSDAMNFWLSDKGIKAGRLKKALRNQGRYDWDHFHRQWSNYVHPTRDCVFRDEHPHLAPLLIRLGIDIVIEACTVLLKEVRDEPNRPPRSRMEMRLSRLTKIQETWAHSLRTEMEGT